MVKANDLQSRCPFLCNGTDVATVGCSDGAMDAENQIQGLMQTFPRPEVETYLRKVADDPENVAKFSKSGYFNGRPRPEQAN
jgi:hypothetical protein